MPKTQILQADNSILHRVSVVIPVYRGEKTLPILIQELKVMTTEVETPRGNRFILGEILLVHDCGPDKSDQILETLAVQFPFVRPIWLSRNFGQHAATLAGMASSTGSWVVTMDEDGQQNPSDIGLMLDSALVGSMQLVYARPINRPPHSRLRNALSCTVKHIITKMLGNQKIGQFNSFRLIEGEIARTLAAYCGNGIYLDMGLFWIVGRIGHCPIRLRAEMDRPSGYSYLKLLGHFWRLLFTSGTRPLRLITLLGLVCVILAFFIAGYAFYGKFFGNSPVQGWASLLIIVTFFSGCILTALGVIAEYLVVTMGIVMGKPLYVVVTKPTRSVVAK